MSDNERAWFSNPQLDHVVEFYQSENQLLTLLTEYIQTGLQQDENCVIIATSAHIQALHDRLQQCGINVVAALQSGRYTALNATDTLAQFMVDGLPDVEKFHTVIGGLVASLSTTGKPIRAYGEMVAHLWKKNNKPAVLALEKMWNTLAESHSFSLFCAYPELHFIMDNDARTEIHANHAAHLQLT